MSIPGTLIPVFNTGPSGYSISRSLRFNSADSANLSRSYSTPTNAKIGTFSFWCKLSNLATTSQTIIQQDSNSIYAGFDNNGTSDYTFGVYLQNNTTKQARVTTQVFRDYGAWYHFLIAVNTPDSTAANRLRLYVNGVEITTFSTSNTVDQNINVFSSGSYRIGSYAGSVEFFGGYLSEIHFIDGQALTPTSFGEFSATTGIWVPKRYVGAYGTNGFKLDFSDNSAATATTLGKDISGNGNNWTPNNLSVTSGAGNDSFVDVPTNGSEVDTGAGGQVRGNYATLNPLGKGPNVTISNGNLDVSSSNSNSYDLARSTIGVGSGKWYWETTINNRSDVFYTRFAIGISASGDPLDNYIGKSANSYAYFTNVFDVTLASKVNNDTFTSLGTGGYTTGDTVMIAFDNINGNLWFGKNGTWLLSGNPSTGANPIFSSIPNGTYFAGLSPFTSNSSTGSATVNLGQRPFAYTAPSGFKALCTANLPAPLVTKPSDNLGIALYSGNDGFNTITTGVNASSGGGLLWIKGRSVAAVHNVLDNVRGYGTPLELPLTAAEYSYSNGVTATSTGFTQNNGSGQYNQSGYTYVAWHWKAGGSSVTNTSGSISSQVSANASAGFSIVTYTGTGSNATVGHGLGVTPALIIVKCRNAGFATNWVVWSNQFASLTNNFLLLNTTASTGTITNYWGSAAPTSTVFGVAGGGYDNNHNTLNHVAYCFAPIAGYSSFGSYTGNGSADGPFVYTGFRPAFVLVKGTGAGLIWTIEDSKRDTYNGTSKYLQPQSSDAEGSVAAPHYDFTSNGFKIRTTDSAWNQSSNTYIYVAFAESPFALNTRAR
jgi:hypothetical protein